MVDWMGCALVENWAGLMDPLVEKLVLSMVSATAYGEVVWTVENMVDNLDSHLVVMTDD